MASDPVGAPQPVPGARPGGAGRPGRPLAVVTRATSGLGRALARRFADHDYDLIVSDDDARLEEAVSELEDRGAEVQGVQTDLATEGAVDELCQVIEEDGRPVEAMAVNAGTGEGAPQRQSLEEVLRRLRRDVASTVHLCRCVLGRMVAEGRGRLLFTTARSPLETGPSRALAEASGSFVRSFAGGLREELADTGVTVTAVVPPAEPPPFEGAEHLQAALRAAESTDPGRVADQGFAAMLAGDEEVVAGGSADHLGPSTTDQVDPILDALEQRRTEPGAAN